MDTEKLQVYVKKYMPFVLTVLIVGMIFFFVLTGCKGDTESLEISNPKYPQWEYTVINANCELDRQSSQMICRQVKNDDSSILSNMMTEMGNQGWELESTQSFKDVTSFIFKRPKMAE